MCCYWKKKLQKLGKHTFQHWQKRLDLSYLFLLYTMRSLFLSVVRLSVVRNCYFSIFSSFWAWTTTDRLAFFTLVCLYGSSHRESKLSTGLLSAFEDLLTVCLFVVCVCCLCFCACARPLFDVRYQDCQCPSHYASGLSGLSTWGWLKQKSTLLEEDSSVRIVANATMNTYKVSLSLPKQSQNIVCTQHTFRGFAKRVTHTSSACSRSMLQAWRQQSSRNARTRRRGRWAIRGPPASFLSAFAPCF